MGLMKSDHFKQLITWTVILLSDYYYNFFFSVVAFLIMSILSACLCLPMLLFGAVGIEQSEGYYQYNYYGSKYRSDNEAQCNYLFQKRFIPDLKTNVQFFLTLLQYSSKLNLKSPDHKIMKLKINWTFMLEEDFYGLPLESTLTLSNITWPNLV